MFKQYRKINYGEFIVAGGDGSDGVRCHSFCQFMSKNKLDVPLVYDSKELATVMTVDVFHVLEHIYDKTGVKPMVAFETNKGGNYEMERLAELNRHNKFDIFEMPIVGRVEQATATRLGWNTNPATRPEMLKDLKSAIDKRLIKIYDSTTLSQLLSFIIVQTSSSKKAKAEKNALDDAVLSLAVTWQVYLSSPSLRERKPDAEMYPQIDFKRRTAGYG